MSSSEQVMIEKMRRFYEIFPYPNKPLFFAPNIEAHLTSHGAFSMLLGRGKHGAAKKIRELNIRYRRKPYLLRKAKLHNLLQEMRVIFPNDKRILLVGCGTDEPLLFRKLHPHNEVIGIDLSRRSILRARRKLFLHSMFSTLFKRRSLKKMEFLQGEAETILHEKALGEFDFVQCFGVLHHQPHPYSFLFAMVERIRLGGVLRMMVYSYHGRRLERRIQARYAHIWNYFLQKNRFKSAILLNYLFLRLWQTFNFFRFFPASATRFRYLGMGAPSVADAFMHPSDPGMPLSEIMGFAEKTGLRLVYCEAFVEEVGQVCGFENATAVWETIVKADEEKKLLSNPLLIFCKVKKIE